MMLVFDTGYAARTNGASTYWTMRRYFESRARNCGSRCNEYSTSMNLCWNEFLFARLRRQHMEDSDRFILGIEFELEFVCRALDFSQKGKAHEESRELILRDEN